MFSSHSYILALISVIFLWFHFQSSSFRFQYYSENVLTRNRTRICGRFFVDHSILFTSLSLIDRTLIKCKSIRTQLIETESEKKTQRKNKNIWCNILFFFALDCRTSLFLNSHFDRYEFFIVSIHISSLMGFYRFHWMTKRIFSSIISWLKCRQSAWVRLKIIPLLSMIDKTVE